LPPFRTRRLPSVPDFFKIGKQSIAKYSNFPKFPDTRTLYPLPLFISPPLVLC